MAPSTLSISIKDRQGLCLTAKTTQGAHKQSSRKMPKVDWEEIFIYVEAVNILLKSYTTNANIAVEMSGRALLKRRTSKTFVTFADVSLSKVVQSNNAFSGERIERLFVDGLVINFQSAVDPFWDRKKSASFGYCSVRKNAAEAYKALETMWGISGVSIAIWQTQKKKTDSSSWWRITIVELHDQYRSWRRLHYM